MTSAQLEKLVLASVEALHKAEWTPPTPPPPDVITPEILGALQVIDSVLRSKGFGLKISTGSAPLGFKESLVGYLGLTVRTPEELLKLTAATRELGRKLFPGDVAKPLPILDVGPSLISVLQNVQRLPWSFEGGMADEQKRIEPPFDHALSPLESLFVACEHAFARAAGNVMSKDFEGFKKNALVVWHRGGGRYWDLSLVYGDSPLVCA